MTDLRTAAQQALEALIARAKRGDGAPDTIAALRAALAKPQDEPVAWRVKVGTTDRFGNRTEMIAYNEMGIGEPLYTAPHQRQPLTDEEIIAANYPDGEEAEPIIAAPDSELIAFSRAIEQAHGIGGQDEQV